MVAPPESVTSVVLCSPEYSPEDAADGHVEASSYRVATMAQCKRGSQAQLECAVLEFPGIAAVVCLR